MVAGGTIVSWVDAISFRFQTGTQWVDLSKKYGSWWGVYNRPRTWALDGAGGAGGGRKEQPFPGRANTLTGGTDDACGATQNFCYLMPGMSA